MNWTQPEEPVDSQSFRDSLTTLIATAAENGVTVESAWECRRETKSWEVDIVRLLAKNTETTSVD